MGSLVSSAGAFEYKYIPNPKIPSLYSGAHHGNCREQGGEEASGQGFCSNTNALEVGPRPGSPSSLPGYAHYNGNNDGNLDCADYCCNEDVRELLPTGDHIKYAKVRLFTMLSCVSRFTPRREGERFLETGVFSTFHQQCFITEKSQEIPFN